MIARLFHKWERRLATVDTNRVVRPFEWGLDWLGLDSDDSNTAERLASWAREALADSDRFFDAPPTDAYEVVGDELRFPSVIETPYPENNRVRVRVFPARNRQRVAAQPRRAVIVVPQWNADEN